MHGDTMPFKDEKKFKEMHRKYNRIWRKRRTEERYAKLNPEGSKCFICSALNKLHLHKKDGKPHKPFKDMTKQEFEYVLLHQEEFVRLCRGCHHYVHWTMKWLKMSWEDIVVRLSIPQ